MSFITENLILNNPDASNQMKIDAQRMINNEDQEISKTLRFLADQSAKMAITDRTKNRVSTTSTTSTSGQRVNTLQNGLSTQQTLVQSVQPQGNVQMDQSSGMQTNDWNSFRSTSNGAVLDQTIQQQQPIMLTQTPMQVKAIKLNPEMVQTQPLDTFDMSQSSLESLQGGSLLTKAIKSDNSLSSLQFLQNQQPKAIKAIKAIKNAQPILTSSIRVNQNNLDQNTDQVSYGASSQPVVQQIPVVQQSESSFGQSQVVQQQLPVVQQSQSSYGQSQVVQQKLPVVQQQQSSYGQPQVIQLQKPIIKQQQSSQQVIQQQRPVIKQTVASYGAQTVQQAAPKPVRVVQQTSGYGIQQSVSGSTECLASQPIYEGDTVTETYCRCSDGSYGFTCTEGKFFF